MVCERITENGLRFLTSLFWGGGDGEGMPLVLGDLWDVDEEVVTRVEVELYGSLNDEVDHLGRQQYARAVQERTIV